MTFRWVCETKIYIIRKEMFDKELFVWLHPY
nr:MAG TPA: protein of unknown function (DUF4514) [Caudoviricetes sp.]